jgi:hypothetical protein
LRAKPRAIECPGCGAIEHLTMVFYSEAVQEFQIFCNFSLDARSQPDLYCRIAAI